MLVPWRGYVEKKRERCLTSLQMMQPSQPRYWTCDQKAFWWLQPQPPSDWYPDQELPRRNQSTHRIMTEKLLFLSHCFAMVGFANLDSWYRKEELGLVFWNTEFEVSTCHESRDILQSAKHSTGALSESLYPWEQTVHQPLGIQNPENTALDLMNPQFDGAQGGGWRKSRSMLWCRWASPECCRKSEKHLDALAGETGEGSRDDFSGRGLI